VSEAVKALLVNDLKIPEQKIRLVHEHAIFRSEVEIERFAVRKSYGLQDGDFAIGMCGSTGWRKGTDLFFRLAQIIKKRDRSSNIKLLWLGGSEIAHAEAMHDAVRLGISEVLRFYPQSEDTSGFFTALDVFALTSREDPFPVAMLEAAAAGVPIICFNQSGGGPEFVTNDAGICVPYADVQKMASACMLLWGDNDLRFRLGSKAKQKVELEYTLQSQAPKLLEVVRELI
jgi:glycosyltransferase involved in cell wall biosynthesis